MSLTLSKRALNQLLKETKKNKKTTSKPEISVEKEKIKSKDVPTTTPKKIKKRKAITGTTASLRKFKKNLVRKSVEHKEKERYNEEVSINPLERHENRAALEEEIEDFNFSYFTTSLSSKKQNDNIKQIMSYMKKEKKGKPKNIEKDDDYYNNDSD